MPHHLLIQQADLVVQQDVVITNSLGLHARPAALFVKVATPFTSNVFIEKDGVRINGKSIMGVMMLAAEQGSKVTVIADGPDEKEAIEKLVELFTNKFYEE
jgi:phosphocarrier protein HPr